MAESFRLIHVIDAHCAGAPLRLVLDGFPSLQGTTMADRIRWLGRHADHLRRAVVDEPRGHADMTGAMLTAAVSPGAHAGLIFMHAAGYTRFCGHGLIAATTIALERGLVTTSDPVLGIDTGAGCALVRPTWATASPGGRARVARVAYRMGDAEVVLAGVACSVGGRSVRIDLVRSHALYALVDGEAAGVPLDPSALAEVRRIGRAVVNEIEAQHLVRDERTGRPAEIEAVALVGPGTEGVDVRSVTVYRDGSVDRSPGGGATAAVAAVLDAMGLVEGDRPLIVESAWTTRLQARIVERSEHDGRRVVVPEIEGGAWTTGEHTLVLDEDDPLRYGFPLR